MWLPPPAPVLRLRRDATLVAQTEDGIVIAHAGRQFSIQGPTVRWLRPCLDADGDATLASIEDRVLEDRAPFLLGLLYFQLFQLQKSGLLRHELVVRGRPLLAIEAPAARELLRIPAPALDEPYRLSAFAAMRGVDGQCVAESSIQRTRVFLYAPELGSLLVRLSASETLDRLAASSPLERDDLQAVLAYLGAAGIVVPDRADAPDRVPPLDVWEPHDLAFHRRSRRGGHTDPVGGTFRFHGTTAPAPALPRRRTGERIALAEPDPSALDAEPPLAQVMESRRSIRTYGTTPIAIEQLGAFLHRVARVRGTVAADPASGRLYDVTSRPYPNGGGAYELEIYVTVDTCAGLASGCYHYDAAEHALVRLATPESTVRELLADASLATAGEAQPQVLLTLTSRFKRLAWKYEGIAYATTLKNAGVLYQSMYLVATAMGLAPCGLGSGDSVLAARAFELDELEEGSVGEFLLGSLPARAVRGA